MGSMARGAEHMGTIPIEAQVSTEQLLHAVEQLPSQEFASFVERLLALRAGRQEPHLGEPETALLLQINQGIDPPTEQRRKELVAKRETEVITDIELLELIRLTDLVEQHDLQRLAALDTLAALRRLSLADLMVSLGVPPLTPVPEHTG